MKIGKAARRKGGAASGELRVLGWVAWNWGNWIFQQLPARKPSSPLQWARRARWRTWGSRDSPWCSQAWAPCTSRSPREWTLGPGLRTGGSSSRNRYFSSMLRQQSSEQTSSGVKAPSLSMGKTVLKPDLNASNWLLTPLNVNKITDCGKNSIPLNQCVCENENKRSQRK